MKILRFRINKRPRSPKLQTASQPSIFMSAPQQQLALLENAMKTHKRIEEITEENEKLKEKLATRQATLQRLQKLTLAAASLLGSVDSTAPETEPSSLACLSRLNESSAVLPVEDETKEDDSVRMICGKYLNQLFTTIVDDICSSDNNMNLLSLLELGRKLNKLFMFAEEKQIIQPTDMDKGWKQGMVLQEQLRAKIGQVFEHGEEEEAEEAQ